MQTTVAAPSLYSICWVRKQGHFMPEDLTERVSDQDPQKLLDRACGSWLIASDVRVQPILATIGCRP